MLPVGLDYDDDGQVMLSPDEAVRSAIGQVYALFAQLGSARQVMMTLRERGLRLPRRKAGARRITWAEASYPAVHDFLTNPAYAGAYVFGKTTHQDRDRRGREVVSRHRQLPQDQWEVLIPGHHPGYLGWDAYQDIQARLRANYKAARGDGGGAARKGAALLSGLLRCGKCGRMMQVGYSGHGGDAPRYVCGAAPSCMAPRRVRASAASTCTAPCWSSCSRCCSRRRWQATAARDGRRRAAPPRAGGGLRDRAGAGPVRSRPGDAQARRGRAGQPAGRPDPGGQARRAPGGACNAPSRLAAARSPPPGPR